MQRANAVAVLLVAVGASACNSTENSGSATSSTEPTVGQPKLVLQITVDQLRGDLPMRYYDRLGDGGFRYLWENGVVYSNAHHAHANTETIVGIFVLNLSLQLY